MQLGAVLLFEAAPLAPRSGGIDVERVRACAAERLGSLPLALADSHFDADALVRHVALPRPGDERALKRLAGAPGPRRRVDRLEAIADLPGEPVAWSPAGAPLRACVPLPPPPSGHTLGIAATRCAGRAFLGISADAARVPDLALFVDAVASPFQGLRRPGSARIHVDSARADGQPLRSYEAEA